MILKQILTSNLLRKYLILKINPSDMKHLLILILLFLSLKSKAQKEIEITAISNENDTLKICALVSPNLFYRTYTDERSFLNNIYFKEENKTKKISTSNLKYLTLVDFRGRKRVFYKKSYNNLLEEDDIFYEEVVKGKITWFRTVSSHVYDNSLVHYNYIYTEKDGFIKLNMFKGMRSVLKKIIINDRPELLKPLNELDLDDWVYATEYLIDFLKLYNN